MAQLMAKNNAARSELRSFASEISTALKEPVPVKPDWTPLADEPTVGKGKEVRLFQNTRMRNFLCNRVETGRV